MRKVLALTFVIALLVVAMFNLHVGPPSAKAVGLPLTTQGDSALAAAGSFKIYPFFCVNGGHIHAPQWVQDAQGVPQNGYAQSQSGGYVYSSLSALRVNVYLFAAGQDTSGFTVPAGGSQTRIPACDSISVLNTGGIATKVTWGLGK